MEKEKENCESRWMVVEEKRFGCTPLVNGFTLKEQHKHWDKEIYLSQEQTFWLIKGHSNRKSNFGEGRQKWIKDFGMNTLTLIEGSNRFGCLFAI